MRWYEWVFLVSCGITGISLLLVIIHSYKTFIKLSKEVEEIKNLTDTLVRTWSERLDQIESIKKGEVK